MISDESTLRHEQLLQPFPSLRPLSRRLSAPTGSHCPESGDWSPLSSPGHFRRIFEGSLMPPWDNAPTLWIRRVSGAGSGPAEPAPSELCQEAAGPASSLQM